jgi:signal transduction histidine kinase
MTDSLIIYVDDEHANRVVFEQSFRGRFNIHCVATGEEALALLAQAGVSTLVTDQRMPGMSGHELLVRAKELRPDVVRVVITAYSDVDPILRAVNDGLVARYLIKPWDRAELEQILAWSIEAAALARHDSALQLRLMATERLVTLGTLGAAVLHDLQQPIASTRLNVDRLAQHLSVVGAAATRNATPSVRAALSELPELLDDLRMAVDVTQGIVAQLQTFLSPSAAPATAERSTDPLPLIRYATSVCRHLIAKTGGTIDYTGPATLPMLAIGGTELAQVLINLISNAAHAIEARGGHVTLGAVAENGRLRLSVTDDGCGMPPDVLRRAGTAFYSTRPDGTGLGLSQCHRLLGAIGARLEIDSKPGAGTTVRFTLPVAPNR